VRDYQQLHLARWLLKPWADEYLAGEQIPMSEELSHAFLSIHMLKLQDKGLPTSLMESFMFQVIHKRAVFLGLKPNQYAVALIACICSSPGSAVSYAAKELTLENITNIFPMGYPSDAFMSYMWDKQKGQHFNLSYDNLLDKLEPL
jgi:hypothetical protein